MSQYNVYALHDVKSGKIMHIDFEENDVALRRKYEMLAEHKAFPQVMLAYPEDFEIQKIGGIDEGTLNIVPIKHEFMFRLTDVGVNKDGKKEE